MSTCEFDIIKPKTVQAKTNFGKKSGFSRQIRAKIDISRAKSRFPENHEKSKNSSPNLPNKLIFGHKVLLWSPQKSLH